ncbi:hypothetical protein E2L08_14960 [Palleronia sediminis]|uniref:Uncharacterized protein n=1 Tax=Palleronia sediminis TaxID=2547833 RepID=A0A4R5ZYB5_9RHOB|nr:hypothetical protein [Palleronia sediminis]TDL75212.1 hypothetical protein E2L08_14960 [Palleronia sediminis]
MIRPELRAGLIRWRETIVGGAAALLGLWWIVAAGGLLPWVGAVLVLVGSAVAWEGTARALRPADGGGAGVVDVTERQITYMSAQGGGAVSLDTLAVVAIERRAGAAPLWTLADMDGRRISVPSDATGADQVADALAALPGLTHAALLGALRDPSPGAAVLWRRAPERLG